MNWIHNQCGAAACALFGLLTSCGSEGSEAPERTATDWNVVLITVDTFRGDHFLESRCGEPLTPNLAQLAARSITFRNASSAGCVTSPGTAAILTGLAPRRSGVFINTHTLAAGLPTLGKILADTGRPTAAFVGNPVIAPGYGFAQGFDVYHLDPVKMRRPGFAGPTLTDTAVDWIGDVDDAAASHLWVHYMDPHGPYQPPDEFLQLFPVEGFEAAQDLQLASSDLGKGAIPRYQHRRPGMGSRDGREYLARYAAEVRHLDAKVGRLIEGLDDRGWLEHTVLVLTADHGEALVDDHGFYFSHGNGLTQDQIHVPLLLYYPGCEAGRVVERPVSTLDILPTILTLIGCEPPAGLDGQSLLSEEPALIFGQTSYHSMIRDGDWKLMEAGGPEPLLVNLSSDPDEALDVASTHAAKVEELARKLEEFEARPVLAEPVSRNDPDRAMLEQLRAIGYAGDDDE